jgi:hypothetical protein
MPLDANVTVAVSGQHTTLLDLGPAAFPIALARAYATTNGTGLGQADRVFTDIRTLAASSTEDLDLAGVLTDAFGATITFARIKTLLVAADAANINNVVVGNAATNGFISWVGGALHTVTVRPGGVLLLAAADATAYTVTAATADLLRIGNSAGGTSVTYTIVLIGASA